VAGPRIRWPNDLLAGGRKIAGVLLESRDWDAAAPLLVLGIGVNVSQGPEGFPPGLRGEATSLRIETGRAPDRTGLLVALVGALDRWRLRLAGGEVAAVEEAFRARAAHLGETVTVLEGSEPVAGVLESVSPVAGLAVRLPGGALRVLRPEHARGLRPAPGPAPAPALVRPARPEDARGIARVHGDTWRAAYQGIVPDAFLAAFAGKPGAADRRRRWIAKPGNSTLVAEEGGEIVGFAVAGPPRDLPPGFDAELYALYVLPRRQGAGLGRRLVLHAAEALAAGGARSMGLWALRDNARARAFYERLGGKPAGEKEIDLGGARLVEVAYGWTDLEGLLRLRAEP
jgi:ribosomal protein S18 acetylase RimI-like enzyme